VTACLSYHLVRKMSTAFFANFEYFFVFLVSPCKSRKYPI
jgi:hypothetical protein